MKLKYEFEKVEIDGKVMAVPVGDNASELHAMLRLNEVAAFILDQLKEEITEEALLAKVKEEYEGNEEEIDSSVKAYINELKAKGIIE